MGSLEICSPYCVSVIMFFVLFLFVDAIVEPPAINEKCYVDFICNQDVF